MRNAAHYALAEILKAMRQDAGLTQREMARRLHVDQTTVCFIESGDKFVRVVELLAWADATGADVVEMVAELKRMI